MIRVFVIAATPMMRMVFSTILTHQDMQVVGKEQCLPGQPSSYLKSMLSF